MFNLYAMVLASLVNAANVSEAPQASVSPTEGAGSTVGGPIAGVVGSQCTMKKIKCGTNVPTYQNKNCQGQVTETFCAKCEEGTGANACQSQWICGNPFKKLTACDNGQYSEKWICGCEPLN